MQSFTIFAINIANIRYFYLLQNNFLTCLLCNHLFNSYIIQQQVSFFVTISSHYIALIIDNHYIISFYIISQQILGEHCKRNESLKCGVLLYLIDPSGCSKLTHSLILMFVTFLDLIESGDELNWLSCLLCNYLTIPPV